MKPLVLAVPVWNAAQYLPFTLESLNAQGEHLRWWLQDGGSQDDTLAMAAQFARSGDTVISERDQGQADAINRAFSKMGGEIIGFINGDDMLTPGTAERVLAFFRMHPHVDLIYGCVEWMDGGGTPSGLHRGRIQSLAEVLDIYNVWWRQRQWVQPEVFFRRSLFEKVGPFDTRLHLVFDYDFWVRCFRAGARVAHVPSITVRFRLHAAQKSNASEQAADEIRSVVEKHLRDASISAFLRMKIQATLDYDCYQLGQTTPFGKNRASFFKSLIKHPTWLLDPLVRNRMESSLAKWNPFRRRKPHT